jgi:hypothetical protein
MNLWHKFGDDPAMSITLCVLEFLGGHELEPMNQIGLKFGLRGELRGVQSFRSIAPAVTKSADISASARISKGQGYQGFWRKRAARAVFFFLRGREVKGHKGALLKMPRRSTRHANGRWRWTLRDCKRSPGELKRCRLLRGAHAPLQKYSELTEFVMNSPKKRERCQPTFSQRKRALFIMTTGIFTVLQQTFLHRIRLLFTVVPKL